MMEEEANRVFIVQRPSVWDRNAGAWKSKYDVSPAAEYGKLIELLGPGNIPFDRMAVAEARVRYGLRDYDSRYDFILAIGDPVAIGMALIAASRAETNDGAVQLLKFDRRRPGYDSLTIGQTRA